MKRILKILFMLFLFLSCYLIYIFTDNDKKYYVAIGNDSSFNNYVINDKYIEYNDLYTDSDYRIIDLVNIIKYNEEKDISIHYLLNKANILTIFIGMNELYMKLGDDTKDIYSYLNEMVKDMEELFIEINKYQYDRVFIIGFYNIYETKNDIFTYINYRIKNVVNNYGYIFIDTNSIIDIDDLEKFDNYMLNNKGFEKIGKIILAYNNNS